MLRFTLPLGALLLMLAACSGHEQPATENQAGNPVSSPGATPVAPTPSTDTSTDTSSATK